jgi:hypothetical protein
MITLDCMIVLSDPLTETSAAPDKWVVDGYPAHYETTYLVSGAK